MVHRGRKVTPYFLSVALALLLVGCSTQFTYNNLNWLVYWYLDDYVELTSEQKKVFEQKLYAWQLWHRYTELPRYQAHLDEIMNDVSQGNVTLARIEAHHQAMFDHWQRLKQKVVPDLVAMAPMLSQGQVSHLFEALADKNKQQIEELAELQSKPSEQQRQQLFDKRLEYLNEWVGKLDAQQRSLFSQADQAYFDNRLLWLEYRTRYQQRLQHVFSSAADVDELQAQLSELLLQPEPYRGEPLQQQHAHNLAVFHQLLFDLGQTLTAKQRRHLIGEIEQYRDDIKALLPN